MPKTAVTVGSAKRGIYLDFEGEGLIKGELPEPALAGTEIEGEYVFWVLDPGLSLYAKGVKDLPWARKIVALNDFVNWLVLTAETQGRTIFFFSAHEAEVIKRFCDQDLRTRFEKRSANAKLLIQKWYRYREGSRPKEATLSAFASYAKLHQQESPKGGVGLSIRRLRAGANGKKKLKLVKDSYRSLWVSFIKYNQNDCEVLRRLTRRAATQIAKKTHSEPVS